eukprot:jgi/Ulvmu1/10542/UM064_0080.1
MDNMDAMLGEAIRSVPNGAQAAKQIWESLNKLAETDPNGYKTFIEQQMRDAQNTAGRSSCSSRKPAAMLTAHARQAQRTDGPKTVILSFFSCEHCPQPNVAGKALQSNPGGQLDLLDVEFREKRPPFDTCGVEGLRCVFELNVHADAVQCICTNKPPYSREVVIEKACRHVEACSGYRVCRHMRTLQVLTDLADSSELEEATVKAKALVSESAAKGTSLEGHPAVVAQLQSIVLDTAPGASPGKAKKNGVIRKPLIQEVSARGQAIGEPMPSLNNGMKPPVKVTWQWTDARGAMAVVSLPTDCSIEDVSAVSDGDTVHILIPCHRPTKISQAGAADSAIKYSQQRHCLRVAFRV